MSAKVQNNNNHVISDVGTVGSVSTGKSIHANSMSIIRVSSVSVISISIVGSLSFIRSINVSIVSNVCY